MSQIINLSVYAIGGTALSTTRTQGFSDDRLFSLMSNPDSNINSGNGSYFIYYSPDGRAESYVVTNTLSAIQAASSGANITGTDSDTFGVDVDAADYFTIANNAGTAEFYNDASTTVLAPIRVSTIDSGKSGTAGGLDVFPSTASKGKIALLCADNTGDTTLTITNEAQSGAASFTIPDSGAGYFGVSTAALTLAEMDVLDGATAGTAVASKALVVDASKDLTGVNDLAIAGQFTGADKIIFSGIETIAAGGTSTALDLTKTLHSIDSDAGGDIFTLADGTIGQVMIITGLSATGTSTITPTNLSGGTSVTFNAAGDSVVLCFVDTSWYIIGGNSYTVV